MLNDIKKEDDVEWIVLMREIIKRGIERKPVPVGLPDGLPCEIGGFDTRAGIPVIGTRDIHEAPERTTDVKQTQAPAILELRQPLAKENKRFPDLAVVILIAARRTGFLSGCVIVRIIASRSFLRRKHGIGKLEFAIPAFILTEAPSEIFHIEQETDVRGIRSAARTGSLRGFHLHDSDPSFPSGSHSIGIVRHPQVGLTFRTENFTGVVLSA